MGNVVIVVPCYNEEKRLNVTEFENFRYPEHNLIFLFVNDGSSDGTQDLLERLHGTDPHRFSLSNLARNEGKAEAVRQGFLRAFELSPDYVGFWDSDLATPLNEIPRLCRVLDQRPEIEVAICARVKMLGRSIRRNALRHYLGRISATVISTVLGIGVYDTQCGAKLFRASDEIKMVFKDPFVSSWIFDVEVIARLIKSRRGQEKPDVEHIIYEKPVLAWHDVAESKLKWWNYVRAAYDAWRIYVRYLT